MPSCQTRSSASSGHGPTLRGWQRALLALPASRSTGLQSLRRHDRLASSACTRFKVALSMTAYSTGHREGPGPRVGQSLQCPREPRAQCLVLVRTLMTTFAARGREGFEFEKKFVKSQQVPPLSGGPQRPHLSVVQPCPSELQCDEGHEDATGHKADTARIGAGRAAARGPQQARDQAASALGACRRSSVPLPAKAHRENGQDPRRRGHPHRTCGRTHCGTTAEPRSWTADEIAGAVCGGVER